MIYIYNSNHFVKATTGKIMYMKHNNTLELYNVALSKRFLEWDKISTTI